MNLAQDRLVLDAAEHCRQLRQALSEKQRLDTGYGYGWKWTKWRCVFLMLRDVVGSISGFEVLFLFCCRNLDIS